MDDKKREERAILARFLSLSRLSKGYKVSSCERPDFLLWGETHVVGLEITKIVRAPGADKIPPLAKYGMHEKIVERAKSNYSSRSDEIVDVSVVFNDLGSVDAPTQATIAEDIARFVIETSFSEPWKIFSSDDDYDVNFPNGVAALRIARAGWASNFWSVSGGGFVPILDAVRLQAEINKKNELLPNYRPAKKQILLMVISFGPLASYFTKVEEAVQHTYRSTFNEIYLFASTQKQFWKLIVEA